MLDFIISINKISLVAFIGTLGFIVYEFLLLKREKDSQSRPNIPNFNENLASKNPLIIQDFMANRQMEKIVKTNPFILIALLVLLFIFGLLSIIGFLSVKNNSFNSNTLVSPSPRIVYQKAQGIKIYDKNFNLLNDNDLTQMKKNSTIIIGIDKISGTDIDKARIRVNKNLWEQKDLTEKFDTRQNMFYIEYITASDEGKLEIEAQLHSKTDGWLGN